MEQNCIDSKITKFEEVVRVWRENKDDVRYWLYVHGGVYAKAWAEQSSASFDNPEFVLYMMDNYIKWNNDKNNVTVRGF